jgi:hypothetical protein
MAIFSIAKDLSVWIVSSSFGLVILVTLVFEHILHLVQTYVEEKASDLNANLFHQLLEKLKGELMILGFISFTVMMLLESHVLSHGSHWVVGFEFAHLSM